MRLLELSLLAYGPFAGKKLDLSHPGPVVHLIYGPNEAGKSTTLRAVGGLLYGIPTTTRDAHTHAMKELRIGGRVADSAGHALSVVRRKGRKNTLLDTRGEPLGEGALSPFLAGVPEAAFVTMFGLDHERLRHGGEQLLAGNGDLGESLFEAGAGADGVHAVLDGLRAQADALFLPRGKRPLNEAIRAYEEARKRVRDDAVRADAFRAQEQALDEARAEEAATRAERDSLRSEQARLTRGLRVLPSLAKRAQLAARREALGTVPALAGDAPERRRRAQERLTEWQSKSEPIARQVHNLELRRQALNVPESLAQLNPDLIRDIRNRLGNHLKAAEDLPRRRHQLRVLMAEAESLLRSLGREPSLERAEALRVDRPFAAHVRKLASDWAVLVERGTSAERDVGEREAAVRTQRERLASLTDTPEGSTLEAALADARASGDLEASLSRARAEVAALAARHGARLAALGGFSGDGAALAGVALPEEATLARFVREAQQLAHRGERLQSRSTAHGERTRRVAQALDALKRGDAPPTELELRRAREQRESSWAAVRERLHAPRDAAPALADTHERHVRVADELVDRMRREARRVSERAALEAEAATLADEAEELARERCAHERECASHDGAWAALWAGTGVTPLPPEEMLAWRGRAAQVVELGEQWVSAQALERELSERHRRLVARLREALIAAHEAPPGDTLGALVHAVEHEVEARHGVARSRAQCLERVAEDQAKLERSARELARAEQAMRRWQTDWDACMARLELPPGTSTEVALEVLDGLALLEAKLDEVAHMRGRIDGMERDARHFTADVVGLVDRHLFQLRELVVEEAAEELARRYEKAQRDLAERERIEQELSDLGEEQAALSVRADEARSELAQLVETAGVASSEDLAAMEERVREARELEQGIAEAEDLLLREGEGDSIQQLEQLAADLDRDRIRPRLDELEQELAELDERLRDAVARVVGLEGGQQQVERKTKAADAASEAEQLLSRVQRLARGFVTAKLSTAVLEREIRRYRDAHQGPIVEAASGLFRRLTLDGYQRLAVGYRTGDEPVLLCVDARGRERDVTALSDGTRDQLYLALRLASVAHFARHAEPLPLVLDDVLIHFDDERATAALALLGELSELAQVLFFTHHARLRDLARHAIAPERLVEHELGGTLPSPTVHAR